MTRILFYFSLVLCVYALTIIGFVHAGGDVPNTFPECGLGESAFCPSFNCPDGFSKVPLSGFGKCCCM